MKKMLVLLLVATACQPHSTARHTAPPVAQAKVKAVAQPVAKALTHPDSVPPVPVRFNMVLRTDIQSQPVVDAAEVVRFFEEHNLAPLIQTVKGQREDYAMNGFSGSNRYRTETVITAAHRNPQNPLAYLVRGLTRTRQRVQAFQGEVVFDSLSVEPLLTAQDNKDIKNWTMMQLVRLDNEKTVKRYAVAGSVRLAEAKTAPHGAAFQGRLVMELELTNKGRMYTDAPFLHGPSQGGGQTYKGTWTGYQTNQATPTVWVESIIGYGPFIHDDFVIGEREVNINPKYAKQGWNTIWENDEWWAKSPKPSLNL